MGSMASLNGAGRPNTIDVRRIEWKLGDDVLDRELRGVRIDVLDEHRVGDRPRGVAVGEVHKIRPPGPVVVAHVQPGNSVIVEFGSL
eukprot:575865-Prorocentrum_minimum.AAC.1